MTLRDAIGRRLKMPRILWFAMLVSQGVYVYVARTAAPDTPADGAGTLVVPLAAAAFVSAMMSFALPMFLHRSAMRRVEPSTMGGAPADLARIAVALYFTPFVLAIALSESVAVFGVVLALQGLPQSTYLPFIGAGALLVLVRFPTGRAALGPLAARLPL